MPGGMIEDCTTRKLRGWISLDADTKTTITVCRNGEFLASSQVVSSEAPIGGGRRGCFEVDYRVQPSDWIEVVAGDGEIVAGCPVQPQIDRVDLLLMGLDVSRLCGLEIGPSSRPAVGKAEGEIYYLDVVDQQGLAEKYRGSIYDKERFPDQASFPKIDFLAGEGTLSDSCGGRRFDYVVASHVIEHVADPIGWLQQIDEILRPGGQLRLAIPDKRYTFDIHRPLTPFAELLDCYHSRLKRPTYRHVYEMAVCTVDFDPALVWRGGLPPPADRATGLEQWRRDLVRLNRGEYVDVHCHTFTPDSFFSHFMEVRELGLVSLELEALYTTRQGQIEFFAHIEKPVGTERGG